MKKIILLVLLLAGAIGGGAWYARLRSRSADDGLLVSGNIEATEVNINFKIAGRVEKRLVDEGQKVTRGQTVAQLDTADLEADVALRRAELGATQAVLAQLLAGSRPDEIKADQAAMDKARANLAELKAGSRPEEIEAAKADFTATEVDRDRLKTERERADRLIVQRIITPEQHDQAQAAWRVATEKHIQALKRYELMRQGPRREEIDQAQATFEQASAQYRLVKEGPRAEEIDQARAKVEQAKAMLRSAEVKLSYATVVSPLTGVVLSKNIEPGEYVAPGTPVVTVADLDNVWLRAYVDERDVGTRRVALDEEAEVSTDAYPGRIYKGRISFISEEAEFTPKTVQTEKERVKLVYRIKIDVKNSKGELKPGMPADARLVGEL
jgi:HlyD family secretion protein